MFADVRFARLATGAEPGSASSDVRKRKRIGANRKKDARNARSSDIGPRSGAGTPVSDGVVGKPPAWGAILKEANSKLCWLSPNNLTVAFEFVAFNKERELIGNSDDALDLQQCASVGKVLDDTIDPAPGIERNRASLELALAQ